MRIESKPKSAVNASAAKRNALIMDRKTYKSQAKRKPKWFVLGCLKADSGRQWHSVAQFETMLDAVAFCRLCTYQTKLLPVPHGFKALWDPRTGERVSTRPI